MPQPRAGRGGEVCRAQHPGWQMAAHRRLDCGKSGKARMLGRSGREVEPGSPRPAQRTREGKLQPRQAANRLKIAERPRRGLPQHGADRDRQRVSVHATEEPAGKPGGHADHARYLHAMVAVSGGLKASLVRRQAAVNDNGLSLRHGPVTLQLVGTPTRAPSRLRAASKIAGARLSLIAAAVRATASVVRPGFLVDQGTSGKERMRFAADFLPDIQRATETLLLVGQPRFTHEPPQAARTLLADDVARLGGVLTGH